MSQIWKRQESLDLVYTRPIKALADDKVGKGLMMHPLHASQLSLEDILQTRTTTVGLRLVVATAHR